jgi:hypothetical protein
MYVLKNDHNCGWSIFDTTERSCIMPGQKDYLVENSNAFIAIKIKYANTKKFEIGLAFKIWKAIDIEGTQFYVTARFTQRVGEWYHKCGKNIISLKYVGAVMDRNFARELACEV